ncbi:hypothetical protein B0H12DRAFT_236575 [Mycena haematopus]|nr:hypothetical protein B0H12DRAFT_236575 [Mycena haematopus]
MGYARLAFFSRLSLVFLLTLLALCSAVPAPAPDYTYTMFGFPVTVHTPSQPTFPAGNGGFGNGGFGGFGGGVPGGGFGGNGGNTVTHAPTTPNQNPTTAKQPPTTFTQTTQQATTSPPPPPPPPPQSPTTSSVANAGTPGGPAQQASSSSKGTAAASSSSKSPSLPSIPADLSPGTSSNTHAPSSSATLDPASTPSSAAAVTASTSSHPPVYVAEIIVPLTIGLALLFVAGALYSRRRRRARAKTENPPTSQWLGGNGAWSRLDMSAARSTPVSVPVSSPQPTSAGVVPVRVTRGTLDITEFPGEAMSVQTVSTPPSSRAPSVENTPYAPRQMAGTRTARARARTTGTRTRTTGRCSGRTRRSRTRARCTGRTSPRARSRARRRSSRRRGTAGACSWRTTTCRRCLTRGIRSSFSRVRCVLSLSAYVPLYLSVAHSNRIASHRIPYTVSRIHTQHPVSLSHNPHPSPTPASCTTHPTSRTSLLLSTS